MTNLEFQARRPPPQSEYLWYRWNFIGYYDYAPNANNAPPQIQSLEIKCTFPWDDISLLLGTIP